VGCDPSGGRDERGEVVKVFTGRTAVVTGAASGIGLGLANRFAAEGMSVVMADVEQGALDKATADVAAAHNAEVLAVVADVSSAEQIQALADRTIERFGSVHVLCNNAGVGSRGLPMSELPIADFEWVFAVNLMGVVHGITSFLPHLLKQDEGHIVNTASVAAVYHLPNMAPYNASKAGVLALSETLLFELEGQGSQVGISVLCPSWVRTNISTSQRNQPMKFAYELSPEQLATQRAYKERRKFQQTRALEPADVADQVFEAIVEKRFYVITHLESFDNIEQRFARIIAGENPLEPRQ
jgi:NAD(P)-dependent dehydrogenase (short-subunit alcohol dehydrogenase family)